MIAPITQPLNSTPPLYANFKGDFPDNEESSNTERHASLNKVSFRVPFWFLEKIGAEIHRGWCVVIRAVRV